MPPTPLQSSRLTLANDRGQRSIGGKTSAGLVREQAARAAYRKCERHQQYDASVVLGIPVRYLVKHPAAAAPLLAHPRDTCARLYDGYLARSEPGYHLLHRYV